MKQYLIILLLFLNVLHPLTAQLTIEECYNKAKENYPLIKQYHLIENTKNYNLSNASKGYLPQVTFSAKASYQSEVTEIPISIPNIKGISKDQYGATIDINQVIWDGGSIKSKKENIRTFSEIEKKNLEADLYTINERVNQVFFGVLLLDAQLKQNKLYQKELQRNYKQMSSWIENGIANQADLNAIKVEQLKAIQNENQLFHTKKAYLDILSALIGEKLNENISLIRPEKPSYINTSIQRPELELFKAQIKNLEAQNQEINAGLMPKLSLSLKGGYGRPGLNMLENDFSAYYIAGINLSWNFSNLYSNKNDKQKIQNNRTSVLTQQETFLFNTNLDIYQKQSEINKYNDQLKYDDDIILLRSSIKESSEVKMANGTISGTDLMRDINAEEQAIQDKILHEIEMLLAIYNLKFITNN